jgi:hypothetical protein
MTNVILFGCSIENKVGASPNGPGGQESVRVEHDAPNLRQTAVATAQRLVAGVEEQPAHYSGQHEASRGISDRAARIMFFV